jgi:phospholipase C
MQENHAYDNLFGTYCPTLGPYCPNTATGIPPGTCVPKDPARPSLGCLRPYNLTLGQVNTDLPHDWTSTHSAWNSGGMNNFLHAEGSPLTFGHYNGSTVPLYWDLAEEYGLADHLFAGSQSYSLSQHWYMFSSLPPPAAQYTYLRGNLSLDHLYYNQSNGTANLVSSLQNSSASWKYYDYWLPATYNQSIGGSTPLSTVALDYWNPLAARAQTYQSAIRSHFVPRSTFFSDAASGALPNVSWIIPTVTDSDHPPENLTNGQDWTASVVDALERSPEWNSTVLFVTWDEYGGFYDHLAPPTVDAYGDGFRVPLLAIGPWVRQGVVDHQNLSFSSILHLMEARFHLPCIGPRDCAARLPLGLFDFRMSGPRAPILFPTNATATYPMALESSGRLPPPDRSANFSPSYDLSAGATLSSSS